MIAEAQACGEDLREQLYNERAQGRLVDVQLPAERIVRLHGVLFDLDPRLYRAGNGVFEPAATPQAFYDNIKPVLARHPLVAKAEIRCSGTGLHAIVWIDPPVELQTALEQERWGQVVKALQRTLPVDPGMPGITALTRPVGSTNKKNNALVETLAPGQPVSVEEIEEYIRRLQEAPFRVVVGALLGGERIEPCPLCGKTRRKLACFDHTSRCYSGCGQVRLEQVLDHVFAPPPASGPAGANAEVAGE
jgi:hypothetical protein